MITQARGIKGHARRAIVLFTTTCVLFTLVAAPTSALASDPPLSVRDFGATPNDTTDDTVAFQKAIDSAPSGGSVYVPAGTYILGQVTVAKPLEIWGAGSASLLKLRSGANKTLLAVRNTTRVVIRDLALDGNISGQTDGYPHGIQFTQTTDSSVTRVKISNCEKSAVSIYDGSDYVSVTNSRFFNNENDVEIHSSAYAYCADNYAEDTQYESWVSYEQVGGPGKAHHNTIVNNVSIDAYAGINLERSHHDVVQGNRIENAQWGIMVQGRDSTYSYSETIENNVLIGGPDSLRWGITVENPSHDNVVRNNTVTAWLGTPLNIQSQGSLFEGNTVSASPKAVAVKSDGVTVRDNTFSGSGQVGVMFTDALSDVVFEGNTVTGAAEEGVLVLEPVTRLVFARNTITGNSTSAPGSLDGLYSVATWRDSVFTGNVISNSSAASAQRRPATIPDTSTLAFADNTLAGTMPASLPQAQAGTIVAVTAAVPEAGKWTCSEAGRPGVWTFVPSATTPTTTDPDDARTIKQTSVEGADRYATNVQISQAAYPDGADVVIVATGSNWPDALGGATLASELGGPILLTKRNELPDVVIKEIRRLGASRAIILGGVSAVGPAVEKALRQEVDAVERIAGASRYDTAVAVATASVAAAGDSYDGTALLATGSTFADALAASPVAAAMGWPLLLVSPQDTFDVQAALRRLGVTQVIILGGTNAVSATLEGSLTSTYGARNVTRLAGANRYSTASAIASWAVENTHLTWDNLAVATGQNFPDALSGGVLQAVDGSVLLLTPSDYLHNDPAGALTGNKSDISSVKYLGGQAAVARTVRNAVFLALK